MFYSVEVTVPANTPATSPVLREVLLTPGVVQQVDVQFPSGCVGLVRTLCRRGTHQVWPSNEGASFVGNNQTISWQDDYELEAAPFVLRLFAWNLDDTYEHTIIWRLSVRNFTLDAQRQIALARFAEALQQLEVEV